MTGIMKVLEDQGFANFHDEFNCDGVYDFDDNHKTRYEAFLNIITNFDSTRINSSTLDKILHNYRLFYDKSKVADHVDNFFGKIYEG